MTEDQTKFLCYTLSKVGYIQYFSIARTTSYAINYTPTNYSKLLYAYSTPAHEQKAPKTQETDNNLKKLIKQASEQIAEVVQQRVYLL
jgi:predicted transcriptional regulator